MRLLMASITIVAYLDVTAVVDEPKSLDREVDARVIFEVLSLSTDACDRGAKLGRYRRIPSLEDYVLISQDRMLIDRSTRQVDNWVLTDFALLDQSLRFESMDCRIPLDRIYA